MIYLYIFFTSRSLYLWCLAGVTLLLSISSAPLGCPFLVLWLLLDFFPPVPIYMFRLLASSVLYLEYIRQIVQGILYCVVPQVLIILPSYHISFSLMFLYRGFSCFW